MNSLEFIESLTEEEYLELEKIVLLRKNHKDKFRIKISDFIQSNISELSTNLHNVLIIASKKYEYIQDLNRAIIKEEFRKQKSANELFQLMKKCNINTTYYNLVKHLNFK